MAASIRKLKSLVLMQNTDLDKTTAQLQAASVPVFDGDCRTCSDPCEDGEHTWPRKFDVDFETQMLGSVKPYARQLLVSTGKADWEREVTDVSGTLAYHLSHQQPPSDLPPYQRTGKETNGHSDDTGTKASVKGLFDSEVGGRLSILNGSHHTLAEDASQQTVLVLPDYMVVVGVPSSAEGADTCYRHLAQKTSDETLKSYILPYACVILLCSHKRRDNRCHIAAPKLQQAFTNSLETRGWQVHEQLDHHFVMDPPSQLLENEQSAKQLRDAADSQTAVILKCSHIGGHRYAGNAIIYTPQGASVWYGRVTPHEVETIVQKTIIEGKVLPSLLRGGMHLERPGCSSLHDW